MLLFVKKKKKKDLDPERREIIILGILNNLLVGF